MPPCWQLPEGSQRFQVIIGPGNGCVLSRMQAWDCLRKLEVGIKVRIMGAAAVSCPPTGIESELGEVREP